MRALVAVLFVTTARAVSNGWYRSEEGESCDEVCAVRGAQCRAERMSAVTSEARMRAVSAMMQPDSPSLDCSTAISVGSDARIPLQVGGGRCYCRAVGTQSKCSLASPSFARLCCCAASGVSPVKACPLTQCAAGRRVAQSGDACITCARGLVSPPDWGGECVAPGAYGACPRGFFCEGSGKVPITGACPGGTFGAKEGLTAASECTPISAVCPDAGHYRVGMGAAVDCPPCPAGAYCPVPTRSVPCPAGRFAPAPGYRTVPDDCDSTADSAAVAETSVAPPRKHAPAADAVAADAALRAAARSEQRERRAAEQRARLSMERLRAERDEKIAIEQRRQSQAARERRRLEDASAEAARARLLEQRRAQAAADEKRSAAAKLAAEPVRPGDGRPAPAPVELDNNGGDGGGDADEWSSLWTLDDIGDIEADLLAELASEQRAAPDSSAPADRAPADVEAERDAANEAARAAEAASLAEELARAAADEMEAFAKTDADAAAYAAETAAARVAAELRTAEELTAADAAEGDAAAEDMAAVAAGARVVEELVEVAAAEAAAEERARTAAVEEGSAAFAAAERAAEVAAAENKAAAAATEAAAAAEAERATAAAAVAAFEAKERDAATRKQCDERLGRERQKAATARNALEVEHARREMHAEATTNKTLDAMRKHLEELTSALEKNDAAAEIARVQGEARDEREALVALHRRSMEEAESAREDMLADHRRRLVAANASAAEQFEALREGHAARERAAELRRRVSNAESARALAAAVERAEEAAGALADAAKAHEDEMAAADAAHMLAMSKGAEAKVVLIRAKVDAVRANATRDVGAERASCAAAAVQMSRQHAAAIDELAAGHTIELAAVSGLLRNERAALLSNISAATDMEETLRARILDLQANAAAAHDNLVARHMSDKAAALDVAASDARTKLRALETQHEVRITTLENAHAALVAARDAESAAAHSSLLAQMDRAVEKAKASVRATYGSSEAAAVAAGRAKHESDMAATVAQHATELAALRSEHETQVEVASESARMELAALTAQLELVAAVAQKDLLAAHTKREDDQRQLDATERARGKDELRALQKRRLEEVHSECNARVARNASELRAEHAALSEACDSARVTLEDQHRVEKEALIESSSAVCASDSSERLVAAAAAAAEDRAVLQAAADEQLHRHAVALEAAAAEGVAVLRRNLSAAHQLDVLELVSKHKAEAQAAARETSAQLAELELKQRERDEERAAVALNERAALATTHAVALERCQSAAAEETARVASSRDAQAARDAKLAEAECEQRVETVRAAAALASEAELSRLQSALDAAQKRDVEEMLMAVTAERDDLKTTLRKVSVQRDSFEHMHDDAQREAAERKRSEETARTGQEGCSKQLEDVKKSFGKLQSTTSSLQAQQRALEDERTAAILGQKRLQLKLKKAMLSQPKAAAARAAASGDAARREMATRVQALSREQARLGGLVVELSAEAERVSERCTTVGSTST